jgi:hypothetical protein
MSDWQVMRQQAEMLVKTGFLPNSIKTPDQAVAIILTGRELGIGTMAALNSINVIAGKPTISPQLMLALINRTGELEDFSVADDGQACAVTMKRRGRKAHTESFSMKDAALMKTTDGYGENKKTISLSEKYNWKQMPAIMRKWRAVAACARVVFPDVILGLYTPDEMGAVVEPESGEVIEVAPEASARQTMIASESVLAREWSQPEEDALIEPEPEPVRRVKVEGAQPGKLPTLKGNAGQITALANALGWTEATLAEEIRVKFGSTIMPGQLESALEFMQATEARTLIQAMKGELQARNGGK